MANAFFSMVLVSFLSMFASKGFLDQEKTPLNIPEECSTDQCTSESCPDSSIFGVPGIPGIPGIPGPPGSCGRPGTKGATGSPGAVGLTGLTGLTGQTGPLGPVGPKGERGENGTSFKGDIGPTGPMGAKGDIGFPGVIGKKGHVGPPGLVGPKGDVGPLGPIGTKGDIGPQGPIGQKGVVGPRGLPGLKGRQGDKVKDFIDLAEKSNWKQCVWNRGDDRDSGLIQNCMFNKKYDYTSLRIVYGGTLSLYNCNDCCKRWYFTFNGAECERPMSIDAILYMKQGANEQLQNIHRHRHIEGCCNKVPKGKVRIGFWVADCPGDYKDADAFSGWISVSRIVIEEVPPPQNGA